MAPSSPFAQADVGGRLENTTIEYTCSEGLRFSHALSKMTIRCRDDGEWHVGETTSQYTTRIGHLSLAYVREGCAGSLFALFARSYLTKIVAICT